MNMYRKVSLSEAFFFYLSLFWRAILLYLMINIVTAFIFTYPLSIMLETEHPVPLVFLCSIITIVIFFFLMVIPVKSVLQNYLKKYYARKTSQGNETVKQLAAPNHLRDVVGNAKTPLRPNGDPVADEPGH